MGWCRSKKNTNEDKLLAARNCLYGNNLVKIADFGLSRNGTCYQVRRDDFLTSSKRFAKVLIQKPNQHGPFQNPKEKEPKALIQRSNLQMSLNKRVPIRWISPETLNSGLYTVKTDVFAFGILCWEIWFVSMHSSRDCTAYKNVLNYLRRFLASIPKMRWRERYWTFKVNQFYQTNRRNNGAEPYPGMTVTEVHQEVRKGYRMEMLECDPDVQALVVVCQLRRQHNWQWCNLCDSRRNAGQWARMIVRRCQTWSKSSSAYSTSKNPKW